MKQGFAHSSKPGGELVADFKVAWWRKRKWICRDKGEREKPSPTGQHGQCFPEALGILAALSPLLVPGGRQAGGD